MFSAATLRPMLASLPAHDPPLVDAALVYEPKYDGIRAIALVEPAGKYAAVRFWSRLGNEKTAQFPELVASLGVWGRALTGPIVLDGEIVALDAAGRPAGFQRLQNRIHVNVPGYRSSKPILSHDEQPTAFVAFDVLRDGATDLRARPLTERRAHLERLFQKHKPPNSALRLSEQVAGDGRALYERAQREGWEGLLVKHATSVYRDGRRSPEWQKLKITKQDEFVVGGWTEPKGTRVYFGSLILGRFDPPSGKLIHVGDVGTGFTGAELERLWKLLKPAETKESPFAGRPKSLGKQHWVRPALVAQVRYTEVTDDGRLRHPTYLGLRDDKRVRDVKEAPGTNTKIAKTTKNTEDTSITNASKGRQSTRKTNVTNGRRTATTTARGRKGASTSRASKVERSAKGARMRAAKNPLSAWAAHADAMTAQLQDLEDRKRDGRLVLPDGDWLDVTNLQKVFWPGTKYTKGDLLRYYARIAPFILPVVEDRPLVMKRFPNGVEAPAFYQHRAPDIYPAGVRVEPVPGADVPTMFIGGRLKTLLYMTQLAAISQDPWFSKMGALDDADVVAIDLDPQPGATFRQIQDVALWVYEELQRLQVPAFPKTSGSEGLHIFIPLPPGTSYDVGVLFCQIIATLVASRHPKVATIERLVRRRPDKTIYVDYLQNIPGKTLACAYSARASAFAGVSTPLTWSEVDDRIAPQDFTIKTIEARLKGVGDLWAGLRTVKPADLARALEKLQA
jgi:bifunctional non-homologous end joining protein LigD